MTTIDITTTQDRHILNLSGIGIKNVLVLGQYKYKQAKQVLETHVHNGIIEICFLAKGRQMYQINNEIFSLQGGDIIITYPGEPHGSSDYPEEKGNLYWMLIKLPEKNDGILNLNFRDSGLLINRLLNLDSRQFRGGKEINHILADIFRSFNRVADPLKKIEITSNILYFILKVIDYGEKKFKKEVSPEIEIICKYIGENINDELNLDSLAVKINLSLSRFKHRFKEELGVPPKEFILREKIDKAKYLIAHTSDSFASIAYELGFSSASYFATVFKRFTLLTPSQFKLTSSNTIK